MTAPDPQAVLVTGAGGFLGRQMVAYLEELAPRPRLVCCDRVPEPDEGAPGLLEAHTGETAVPHPIAGETPVRNRSDWVIGNLREFTFVRRLVEETRPSVILHLAGRTPPCDDAEFWADNLGATVNLLETVRSLPELSPRVLVVGSAAEYGPSAAASPAGAAAIPVSQRENDPCRPTTAYGRSKLAQTMLCRQYARDFGVHVVTVRPFNLIGPGTSEQSVVGTICAQISGWHAPENTTGPAPLGQKQYQPEAPARERAGRPAHDSLDSPSGRSANAPAEPDPCHPNAVIRLGNVDSARDFLDVRDAARAFWTAATQGAAGEVYNVCSGRVVVIREVAERLAAMAGHDVVLALEAGRLRDGDVRFSCGDPGRLRALGWEPRIDLDTSLQDTLDAQRRASKNLPQRHRGTEKKEYDRES